MSGEETKLAEPRGQDGSGCYRTVGGLAFFSPFSLNEKEGAAVGGRRLTEPPSWKFMERFLEAM